MKDRHASANRLAGKLAILAVIVILCLGLTHRVRASSLLYKSYVIRYDRGWDILCEPYEVKPNDWVLKIFRQKGEIASRDFREFLGIFKRLNPHVKNVDRIRPGQIIDIPLKKIDPGTLPGQASGIVTIPFVTLSRSSELIHQHSKQYRVRKGDTVSKLIARRFGRFGTKSYKEGVKLFKAANPGIKNLNLIYAGQRIYLPDPSIRKQTWYASLYDKKGNIRNKLDPQALAASAAAPLHELQQMQKEQGPDSESDPLKRVAAAVEGKLYNRGTYYFPRQGQPDFELDLERYPVLDMNDGQKIIFTHESRIMDVEAALLETYWPNVKIITLEEGENAPEILDKVFRAIEGEEQDNEIYYAGQGTRITVRAKWIKPATADGRRICITPIETPSQKTPEPIRRYLEQNGIVLKEILAGNDKVPATNSAGQSGEHHRIKPVMALAPTGIRDLVGQVLDVLGYGFSTDIEISFPYAGIQVKARSNLISSPDGGQWLVDFGDLYGDAVAAIEKSGLPVIQIKPGTDEAGALEIILRALGKTVTRNPSYLAADRPPDYNILVTVEGILVEDPDKNRYLLTNAALHPAVADLITSRGIKLVEWSS